MYRRILPITCFILLGGLIISTAYADRPLTFSKPKNLSNDSGFSEFPEMAASGSNVYVVWQGEGDNGWGAHFAKSNSHGANFKPARIFTEQDISYFYPQVAASGEHVYLAWLSSTAEGADPLGVTFKASHNYGKDFDPIIQLQKKPKLDPGNVTKPFVTTSIPEIAATQEHVYVAWHNAWHVYLRASHDNGVTFTGTRTLVAYHFEDFQVGEDQVGGLSVAASGNRVFVAWQGLLSGDIYFRASHDGGRSFGKIINLSNNPYRTFSEAPEVTVSEDNAYVTWLTLASRTNPGYRAMFVASNDGGRGFGEPIILGGINPSSASLPKLAADGNNVYATWGGIWEVFFRSSHDKGKSFGPVISANEQFGLVYFPQVYASEGKLYIAWIVEHSFETYDAFVRVSEDGGVMFGPSITALDDTGDLWLVSTKSGNRIYLAVGGLEVTFAHS